MALVAGAFVAIIAMAALSIDVGTLYQAKAEAQRAADAAALAGARTISISGITGDPTSGATDGSWGDICGSDTSPASLAAKNAAQQNLISGVVVPTINVYYGAGSTPATNVDCRNAGANFGVNPVVTVTVQSANLPVFFARIFSLFGSNFSATTVGAKASAEVYNPSQSGPLASGMIPVQPRCVKPLIVANRDPANGGPMVDAAGAISTAGIYQINGGLVGETFTIRADCEPTATNCNPGASPGGNMIDNPPIAPTMTQLDYIPAYVNTNSSAVTACSSANVFQQAIGGCDQTTVYACGVSLATEADMTINPGSGTGGSGDTATAAQCLIHQSTGQDSLAGGTTPSFPFQIQAGAGNPLVTAGLVNTNDIITSSSSVVTLPIGYFNNTTGLVVGQNLPFVTIAGFLQVFVQSVDTITGNITVTVLNVAGCGNAATNPPVFGTSPVPVRLITSP